MPVRIGPAPDVVSEDEGEASSSTMSSARETSEVSGMRWCWSACWALVRRSHSSAMAVARAGLECGIVRMAFDGRRRGRVSRWI